MRPFFFFYILDIMSDITIREQYKDEYRAWRNMRQRCLNPKVPNYHRYGGRGITICKQWDSFETFLEDMGVKPSKDRSLERRDNNGNYEPGNCYWATRDDQENNKERSVKITYRGKTKTLTQWARELGMDYELVRSRWRYGWEADAIFREEKNVYSKERRLTSKSKLLTYNGKTLNIAQWAKELGCSYDVLRARDRYGWPTEKILGTPVKKSKLYPNR